MIRSARHPGYIGRDLKERRSGRVRPNRHMKWNRNRVTWVSLLLVLGAAGLYLLAGLR